MFSFWPVKSLPCLMKLERALKEMLEMLLFELHKRAESSAHSHSCFLLLCLSFHFSFRILLFFICCCCIFVAVGEVRCLKSFS